MGDGVRVKRAVIINGDREARHLENAKRAAEELKAKGYEIYLVNPEPIESIGSTFYAPSTREGLVELGEKLGLSDDDDSIVYYFTGHGGGKKSGDVALLDGSISQEDLYQLIGTSEYHFRVVVMDQCTSGVAASLWSSPGSLFISPDWKDRSTVCNYFAPYFWAEEATIIGEDGDMNDDGAISIQERFAYASKVYSERITGAVSLFIPGSQFVDTGFDQKSVKPTFSEEVVRVSTRDALQEKLDSLEPGQFAVVDFSATWCGPCHDYEPVFEHLAAHSGGRFLFIQAKAEDTGWMREYQVRSYPTIKIVDHAGKSLVVRDRLDPLRDLFRLAMSDEAAIDLVRDMFEKGDEKNAIVMLAEIAKSTPQLLERSEVELLVAEMESGEIVYGEAIKRLIETRPEMFERPQAEMLTEINLWIEQQKYIKQLFRAAYDDYRVGNIASVIQKMPFVVTLNPGNYDAWVILSDAFYMGGHYEEAIRASQRAIGVDAERPGAYNILGLLAFARSDLLEAKKQFELSVDRAGDWALPGRTLTRLMAIPDHMYIDTGMRVGGEDFDFRFGLGAMWALIHASDKVRFGPQFDLGIAGRDSAYLDITTGIGALFSNSIVLANLKVGVGYNFLLSDDEEKGSLRRAPIMSYEIDTMFNIGSRFHLGPQFSIQHGILDTDNYSYTVGLKTAFRFWN